VLRVGNGIIQTAKKLLPASRPVKNLRSINSDVRMSVGLRITQPFTNSRAHFSPTFESGEASAPANRRDH
jgi:hypothetical protein